MRRFAVTMATVACLGATGMVSGQALAAPTGGTPSGAPAGVAAAGVTVAGVATTSSSAPQAARQDVVAVRALRIRTTYLNGAERTRSYRARLAATGGTTPYRWSITTGALPRGLALSRGGLISGTPKASGATTFTVQVKDARGKNVRRALTIAVAPRGGFRLTTTSVGPVTIPAKPALAINTLTRSLGKPSAQYTGPGCELRGPGWRGRSVTWDGLTVRGEAESDAAMRLDSWTLSAGRVPLKLALPYQVTLGTTLAQVRAKVPGVEVMLDEVFSPGDYWATQGTMLWWVDGKTKRVTSIHHNPYFCD